MPPRSDKHNSYKQACTVVAHRAIIASDSLITVQRSLVTAAVSFVEQLTSSSLTTTDDCDSVIKQNIHPTLKKSYEINCYMEKKVLSIVRQTEMLLVIGRLLRRPRPGLV
jgi:hypothetical protein